MVYGLNLSYGENLRRGWGEGHKLAYNGARILWTAPYAVLAHANVWCISQLTEGPSEVRS